MHLYTGAKRRVIHISACIFVDNVDNSFFYPHFWGRFHGFLHIFVDSVDNFVHISLWGLYIQFYLSRCIYRKLFMWIPAFSEFSPFFLPINLSVFIFFDVIIC